MTSALSLATELVTHLRGWTATADDRFDLVRLVHTTGASIVVHVERYQSRGRVEFVGDHARNATGARDYCPNGNRPPRISCALSRPVEAIAADIRRRLLPEYDAWWGAETARIAAADEREADAVLVSQRLAEIVGGDVGRHRRYYRDDVIAYARGVQAVGRIVVRPDRDGSGPTCTFDLTGVDVETTAEILRLVKAAEERVESRVRAPAPTECAEFITEDDEQGALRLRRISA